MDTENRTESDYVKRLESKRIAEDIKAFKEKGRKVEQVEYNRYSKISDIPLDEILEMREKAYGTDQKLNRNQLS